MVTHGWNAAILRGLQARKSSHKEFSFLLVAIKCLSAFLFFIVCHPSYRLLKDFFFLTLTVYVLLCPIGGDGGSEGGGEWGGAGLPATSSYWH